MAKIKGVIKRVWAPLCWLIIWQLGAMLISQELILVSPINVIKRLFVLLPEKEFIISVLGSLSRILTGFVLGLTFGTVLATLAGKFKLVREFFAPMMNTVKAIPVASFTVLALFIVSSDSLVTLVTFLIALPVVYSNILTGIDSTDKKLLEMAEIFRISTVRKTVYIYFSELLPYFKTATTVASGLSFKSGVAAEIIVVASNTIGGKIYDAKTSFESADLFAWTLVVIVLSIITEYLFKKLTDLVWWLIQKI